MDVNYIFLDVIHLSNIHPFHMDSDISQCQLSQKIKISASIWTFFFCFVLEENM